MIFGNIKDAFNFYNGQSVDELEKRAAEISDLVEKDPKADVKALNIELEGIKQAKENIELRSQMRKTLSTVRGGESVSNGLVRGDTENLASTAEYRSAFFKTLLGRDLNETERGVFRKVVAEHRSGSTFNQTSNSGAVLPTQTLEEIVSKARTMGGLLAECRAFNVPANVAVPVATPSANAAWHTEGQAVDSVNASVASVNFAGFELIKLFSMSVKVNTMSIAAFESYLVQELTDCIFGQLDYSVVNGTGSGQGTGLESISWVASEGVGQNAVQATTKITYANIVSLAGLLKRGYANGAVFACNNKFLYSVLYSMLDKNDRPIFVQDVQREGIGHVLGFPVVVDDNIADDEAYLGNFKFFGYNLADGITIEASRESSFRSGLIDYRAMAVADCKPIVSEAFVKLYLPEGGGDDTTTETTTTEEG